MYNCGSSPYEKDIAVRWTLNQQISTLLICGRSKSENSEVAEDKKKTQPGMEE